MKILVAVPSKNRPDGLQKDTLSWLRYSNFDWKVFLEPQDAEHYAFLGQDKIITLPLDNQGLGYSKESIGIWADQHGYEAIFKCDDDLIGWAGKDRKVNRLTSAMVFDQAIKDGIDCFLARPEVKGISYPYSNQMFNQEKWQGNQRTQTCYFVRTENWHGDRKLSVFEDFAQFIHIRVHGGECLRYGWAGISCRPVGKNKGGHQDTNRGERAIQEASVLRGMYSGLKFRKVTGKNWELEPDMHDPFLGASTGGRI